ncbi:porin [Horticoccus sp. 23ND18S-11]|uniref:porin n=1 Tax=Horticoccus sp. 23ND18S-11 TaxID=3391832 RepID=UPI0039C9BEDF
MLLLRRYFALAGCLCAAVANAQPDAAAIEARLSRLEAALARIEARLGDRANVPELAPVARELSEVTRDVATKVPTAIPAQMAGREEKLAVGGLLQVNAGAGGVPDARYDGVRNRFLVRRARLMVRGSFAENVDFMFLPEFGNAAITGVSGYRGQLTDAYVTWRKYPQATLQAGQFKTPFGYEQLISDAKVVTVERSLPNDRLTFGRQIGASLSGVAAGETLTYSAGLFNGNGTNNGNNDNDQMMSAARVGAVVWTHGTDSLRINANLLHSRDTGVFTGTRDGRGIDVQFARGPLEVAAEYLRVDSARAGGSTIVADGWMAQATWFFGSKIWQAVARFETFDANRRAAGNVSDGWVLGFNYYLKGDDLKLSFNYHLGNPAGPQAQEDRVLGRVQVVF